MTGVQIRDTLFPPQLSYTIVLYCTTFFERFHDDSWVGNEVYKSWTKECLKSMKKWIIICSLSRCIWGITADNFGCVVFLCAFPQHVAKFAVTSALSRRFPPLLCSWWYWWFCTYSLRASTTLLSQWNFVYDTKYETLFYIPSYSLLVYIRHVRNPQTVLGYNP